jgi:hypothetical protein
MRSRSDEFRAHALECQKLADFFGGLIRCQYEELARQWLELAERADGKSPEISRQLAATADRTDGRASARTS